MIREEEKKRRREEEKKGLPIGGFWRLENPKDGLEVKGAGGDEGGRGLDVSSFGGGTCFEPKGDLGERGLDEEDGYLGRESDLRVEDEGARAGKCTMALGKSKVYNKY